jgi:iron complex outermembrane recepter protein
MRRAVVLFLLLLVSAAAAAQNVSVTGTVTTEGSALPGVTVSIDELGLTTVTGSDGRYLLAAPASGRTVKLTATLQGFAPRTATVRLEGAGVTHDFAMRPAFGQEITVGSRAVGAEEEKAVPIDIIPLETIVRQPSTETNQIIQKVAPSFNFPRPTITDGTDSVRPATLRGLGPDQLLVMLNSKRRHPSALINANNSVGRGSSGVDLNAIPAGAIQSVEILRDGAAAQYGSDAIAGVLNIVLKSGEQPLTFMAHAGMTTHGDGETLDTTLSGGWKVGRGSLFAIGEYRRRGDTNRAAPDPRDQIRTGDALQNGVHQPNHHWGDAYVRDLMTFANFNMPTVDEKHILYAFGGYSVRHGSHGGFFRRALDARNHPQIYPFGFLPLIEPRVSDMSLSGGMRGQLGMWFYDASLGWGDNRFEFEVTDSLNASLGPTLPPNQTKFYAGALELDQQVFNLDLSRRMTIGNLAGPVNVAFGAEWRRDGYGIEAGEPNSYLDGGRPDQFGARAAAGAQVFPGFRPANEVDESRNSKAVYVDVEGDVTTKLRVGLAGRFEDFSDFGNTTNGKLTLRYSPVAHLIFRGAVSTGFRAPSLGQSWFSAVSTNFLRDPATGQLAPFEVGTYPVNSAIARALGAEDLKPEKSQNFSGGVVWQPTDHLEITADYFHIDIEDRIVFSGNFTGARVLPLIQPLGVTGARFFTNAIDTETKGFDIVANYEMPLATMGRLDFSGALSHNSTDIAGAVQTPAVLAGLEETLFDRIERRRIECGQPHTNVRLSQSWTNGPLGVTARQARYGEYCSFTLLPVDDQTYSAKTLVDLEASYRWRDYTFALGAENIFDVFPDENIPNSPQGNFGIFPYPSQSPFGMNGRYVYTRIEYRF